MSKITNVLMLKDKSCVPIWFMRQAGRYLPEFRKIRKKNKNFIKLCLNSNLSSKITLQPLKRFNLDAAIIFSDILIVPFFLGSNVKFIKNKGPILSNFKIQKFIQNKNKKFTKDLKPIYNTINKTRKKLHKSKSLISFVGAPWTLIVYMLGLKDNNNKLNLEKFNKNKKQAILILNKLNEFLCIHIKNQIDAGADTVQIFDSWAGLLPRKDLNTFCYEPNQQIVNFCKKHKIPVICFPKGIKRNYSDFYKIVKPNGISIDYDINPEWARKNLNGACIQGGMDPKILFQKDKIIFRETKKYLDVFKNYPYIFNLGHGLLPKTDPNKINKLINFIKNYE